MSNKIDWKSIAGKIYPWIICGGLFLFYTRLFYSDRFGVQSYVLMICVNTIFLFGLLAFPRLKEFNLRELKLVLAEIKEKKEEIFATEKQVKGMAIYIGEVLGFLSLIAGRMGNKEHYDLRRGWVTAKLHQLKRKACVDLHNIDVYTQLFKEYDELVPEGSNISNPGYEKAKARMNELENQLDEQMRKDIAEMSHEQD